MKRLSPRAFLALSSLLGPPSRVRPAAAEASASPTPPAPPSAWPPPKLRDPYVAASPLSAAAVCRDGVALVSLHYPDDADEPPADDDGAPPPAEHASSESEARDPSSNDGTEEAPIEIEGGRPSDDEGSRRRPLSRAFRDLPLSSRGPLRIEPVHEERAAAAALPRAPPPLSLLTAGWRADGLALADAARELMAEEVRLYRPPSLGTHGGDVVDGIEGAGDGGHPRDRLEDERRGNVQRDAGADDAVVVRKRDDSLHNAVVPLPYYGRRIAEGLSYHMAKRVFSEGIRSLSSVGLLACGNSDRRGTGSLYLVDAQGKHQVRAHAVGNGSSALHARMAYTDFGGAGCREGLRTLLCLIAEEGGLVPRESTGDDKLPLRDRKNPSEEEQSTGRQWNLPPNAAVELAVLRSGEGRMRRVRLSTLFSEEPR